MQTQSPHSANGAKRLQSVSDCASGSVAPRVLLGHVRQARVALLSTWHPEPADNGRKQRTRIIIDALAREHEVFLISLVDPADAARGTLPVVSGVAEQFLLPLPVFKSLSLAGIIGTLSPLPRSIFATWNPATAHQINRILSEHEITVAIGTDLRTLRYLTNLPPGVARILDEPDVSPFVSTPKSLRSLLRQFKYHHFLEHSRNSLDAVALASELEEEAFANLSGGSSFVIANVVPEVPGERWSAGDATTLLYTGALTYRPNLEAIEFMSRGILEHIQAEYPDLQLIVTGAVPEPRPAVCENPLLTFTGRVPSLDRLYRESRLFVVPLLTGTGTRIKLLEAMSYGMPVVSTRKGAEGLPVVDGEHLLLADSCDEFIAAILLLLGDRERCERLGGNARQLIVERFSAAATASIWDELVVHAMISEQERTNRG